MSRERERFEEVGKKIKRESADAFHQHHQMVVEGRRHMLGPPGTLNTVTPCAACKLLRRRCAQECPFSPYFSPHEPQKFASVHKVFGASNVSKMLMDVAESQRADAANSLVYEANVRIRDPIYGCLGAISTLQQQVQFLQAELNTVKSEILKYKSGKETNNTLPSPQTTLFSTGPVSVVTPPTAPPPPPQLHRLRLPSSSSMYKPVTSSSATDFSTITNENSTTYFG